MYEVLNSPRDERNRVRRVFSKQLDVTNRGPIEHDMSDRVFCTRTHTLFLVVRSTPKKIYGRKEGIAWFSGARKNDILSFSRVSWLRFIANRFKSRGEEKVGNGDDNDDVA